MIEPIRILYADSVPDVADRLAASLERDDGRLDVSTVGSAEAALNRLAGDDIDCLVTAADLADATGLELLERVRETRPGLPVVLYPADPARDLARNALAAGVTEYVPRPTGRVAGSLLATRIVEAVTRHRTTTCQRALERINGVVRAVDRALVRASTRSDIHRRVCEIVSQSEPYSAAWIGEHDPETRTVTNCAVAGLEDGDLEESTVTIDDADTGQRSIGKAVRTGEVQVVERIPDDESTEPCREQPPDLAWDSSAAVPLVYDETCYGVLTVAADRPDAFAATERELLAELGERIAHALDDIQVRDELRRFRRAIDHAADAVFVTDADGTIEYVNPAFESLTGYAASDAVGRNPRILKSGEFGDEYYERLWETIRSGSVWQERIVNETRSGERYLADQTIAPITDETDAVEGFVAVQRDITEREERERALERSRERLRVLFDQAPDGIVVHDASGAVLDVNEALVENLGYAREELLSMSVWEFDVGIDEDTIRDRWAAMDAGSTHKIEIESTHRRADGSTYPAEVWISRMPTHERDDRFVGFVRDVTERTQRIRQLRVLDRVLRHNLNNEMTVIRGYAQTIAERASGDIAEYARGIVSGSDQLLETIGKEREIVDVLTDLPDTVTIDLVDAVERIVSSMRRTYPDARIEADLPERARVKATANLGRAIEELVDNGIRHNDRDAPAVTVAVTHDADAVVVRVTDDGPGIPDEEVRVLTGEEEPADPLYHGSGLGLWLAYWIVERSDGAVSFEPNRPRGSAVAFALRPASAE